MPHKARISVVIPIWNGAVHLPACLESVVAQTLGDIEILCVDDGSVDHSSDVVCAYARRDKRIRLISQNHSGAGAARNRALAEATGEYVAFMDADDLYPSDCTLERVSHALHGSDASVCGGGLIVVRGETRIPMALNTGSLAPPPFRDEIIQYQDYQVDYGFQLFVYSRSLLASSGATFPGYARFQDPPFFVKAMHAATKFIGLSVPTYCHRRGHRRIVWSDAQTSDVICGIRDNLRFSQQHSLQRLHALCVWRLREEYRAVIETALTRGAVNVRAALHEAEAAIVPALLETNPV